MIRLPRMHGSSCLRRVSAMPMIWSGTASMANYMYRPMVQQQAAMPQQLRQILKRYQPVNNGLMMQPRAITLSLRLPVCRILAFKTILCFAWFAAGITAIPTQPAVNGCSMAVIRAAALTQPKLLAIHRTPIIIQLALSPTGIGVVLPMTLASTNHQMVSSNTRMVSSAMA